MDILESPDGQGTEKIYDWAKKVEKYTSSLREKKGQLVNDHPSSDAVVNVFTTKLIAKSTVMPSSTPGADIIKEVSGKRDVFPNPKAFEERYGTIYTPQVYEPYPPCIIAEKDLKPIKISEMQLETHHRGRKVLLHIVTPPDRTESVLAIAEDEDGTAILLRLFNQPADKHYSCSVGVLDYNVCIVKEPFFQRAFDSYSVGPLETPMPYYSLRIDHPGDIIALRHDDERILQRWRKDLPGDFRNSRGSREQGNRAFDTKDWALAQFEYSQALKKAKTPKDERLSLLNRSLTNLKIGRPAKALLDATRACDPFVPSEKTWYRQAMALYNLGRFEDCQVIIHKILGTFPNSKAAKAKEQRLKARLLEQRTGKYNFKQMYEQAKADPPLIDCATFSTRVEIRDSPGRGRGLFTTESVSAGDLLLVEKAFAYSFIDETRLSGPIIHMVNFNTNRITGGGFVNLWPQVVQKLYHDPDSLSAFEDLFSDGFPKVTTSECDGAPVVDSFLVEKILSINAFGCPRTTRDFCKNTLWSGKKTPSTRERPVYLPAGLWLLAARINHSCVGNCRRSFIGDMQIIRAARDIPAGTELTFPYRPSHSNDSYKDAQERLAKWGVVCDCELCKVKQKTTEAVRVQRHEVYNQLYALLLGDPDHDLDTATKLLKGVEKTYRGKAAKQIRWPLADFYGFVAIRCRERGDFVKAAEFLIKALEAMGYVITATAPGEGFGQSRFEVKHWGMMEVHIPWFFFQLIECYDEIDPQLVERAQHYARLAYSIIVGEGESMWDVLPATGNQRGTVEEGFD